MKKNKVEHVSNCNSVTFGFISNQQDYRISHYLSQITQLRFEKAECCFRFDEKTKTYIPYSGHKAKENEKAEYLYYVIQNKKAEHNSSIVPSLPKMNYFVFFHESATESEIKSFRKKLEAIPIIQSIFVLKTDTLKLQNKLYLE